MVFPYLVPPFPPPQTPISSCHAARAPAISLNTPFPPSYDFARVLPLPGMSSHISLINTAALSTIAKLRRKPKCLSTDKRIKMMWYIYTTEYYSAIKKNEILPFVMTWMELECIMLNKTTQSEKDKYHMISLMYGI